MNENKHFNDLLIDLDNHKQDKNVFLNCFFENKKRKRKISVAKGIFIWYTLIGNQAKLFGR